MRCYRTDIFRTIKREWKRFLAIVVISALSLTMLTGLQASCHDLQVSADAFFDIQNLHDILIQSSLGLTKADVKALKKNEFVIDATGNYEETVHVNIGDESHSANVKTYADNQVDMPYLIDGHLPQSKKEIAVSQSYINQSHKAIGDSLTIHETLKKKKKKKKDEIDFEAKEKANFKVTKYKIVGIVVDPTDINAVEGGTSFRSTATTDYTFYVLNKAVDTDIYTSIALTIADNNHSLTDRDTYGVHLEDVMDTISTKIKPVREKARTKSIKKEANKKVDDALKDLKKEFKKAAKKLRKGKRKLQKAKKKLNKGKRKLDQSKRDLDKSARELKANKAKSEREFKKSARQIANGLKQIKKDKVKLKKAQATLNKNKTKLQNAKAQLDANEPYVPYMSEQEQMAFNMQKQQVEADLAQIKQGQKQLNTNKRKLTKNKAKLQKAKKTLARTKKTTRAKLAKAQRQINKGYRLYRKGVRSYRKGLKSYYSGLKKYKKNVKKYKKEKKKALKKIDEARDEIDDLESAKWYLQNRSYMSGYNNVKSDADSIESLAVIFSIIFLIVALLMCMTTINRMVEEERGLIGTYQALGMNDSEIRLKYMAYALLAALTGSILGNIGGFVGFPAILFVIFHSMYQFPNYTIHFMPLYGIGGTIVFLIAVTLTVVYTCSATLKQMPATLMRPKAPKAGSRVMLEYITPVWKRLSFLNKVTARNLFRYKKRLLMTIIGIAGCTSLLVTGFAINDSVNNLIFKQYDIINHYDYLGVVSKGNKKFGKYLKRYKNITHRTSLKVESVTVRNEKNETQVIQVYIFPDKVNLREYISLNDAGTGQELSFKGDGIYASRNAGDILNFKTGDVITLENMQFVKKRFKVTALVENYLGNVIYMKQSLYQKKFGKYKTNAQMVCFNNEDKAVKDIAKIKQYKDLLTSVSTDELKATFNDAVVLIHIVVYLIIVMAAALAFAVLFTLSTTNISERERELATIKVLGFFDNEVHLYVNKETLILTSIGIVLGIPLGVAFSHSLTPALKMPSLYFAVTIKPMSYYLSIILSAVFALIVNLMTNQTLNAIDPIEALKSVE